MKLSRRQFVAAGTIAASQSWSLSSAFAENPGKKIAVVGQAEATATGLSVLEQGGNAADAIIAAALVAGVVALPSTGIGGYGGTCMVATPDGQISAIDMNTIAPSAMREDQYYSRTDNSIRTEIHAAGWTSVGVPGVLAGLARLHAMHATWPLARLMEPAIRAAHDGFKVNAAMSARFRAQQPRFVKDPGSAKLYLTSGGDPLPEGATYRNPDLGRMLERLAADGSVDAFYRGKFAEQIAQQCQRGGGWLTAEDMADYKVRVIQPIVLEWQGVNIYTLPPSAGGLTVLQTLHTLKSLGWPEAVPDNQRDVALVEAMRIAWESRLKLLGDPDKVEVPIARLISRELADQSAEKVKQALTSGKPNAIETDGRGARGTIHLNAVDAQGMSIALTFTHGDGFGAGVTVDGLGLTLGHGLSRFDPRPGRANSPGPSKRPLHNMCPMVVTRDNLPLMAIGATGGRRIVSALTCVLANRFGSGLPIAEAAKVPRMHTEGGLEVMAESKFAGRDALTRFGYKVSNGAVASLTAIERAPNGLVVAS